MTVLVLAVYASKAARLGTLHSFAVLHCSATMAALAAKHRRDATSVHARGLRMRGGHGPGVLAGCRSSQARADGHLIIKRARVHGHVAGCAVQLPSALLEHPM